MGNVVVTVVKYFMLCVYSKSIQSINCIYFLIQIFNRKASSPL